MAPVTEQRFEVIMDAGNGAQKAGDILIKAFARSGLYVFIEPMIPAEISPPKRTSYSMSGVIIRLSNTDKNNIGNQTDLMVVEHEILLKRRLEDQEYAPGCIVLLDMGDQKRGPEGYEEAIAQAKAEGLRVLPFEMSDDVKTFIKELRGNGKNMFYLGLLTQIYSADQSLLESLIRHTFKKLKPEILEQNIKIYEAGIALAKDQFSDITVNIESIPDSDEKVLMDGNTALAMGIIDAGFKLYSGYPITPASSILHTLAQKFASYGGMVHQAEDEISAIGAAIGAYYAGAPAITGTSGPGFSLKQEFLGLASSTEVPCVVIDVQRGGPSTGLPTKTEQGDLFAAAFGSHGDSPKVVLSVANVSDCFYAPHVARYLTEKLRLPVVIMSDYVTSVSYKVLPKLPLNKLTNSDDILPEILDRFRINKITEPVEYVVENQSIPGEPGKMRRVTGLNTDAKGQVAYTTASVERSNALRNEKLHIIRRALQEPELFGKPEGDVLIVGWGSMRGVIQETVEIAEAEGLSVSGLHLKVVNPLPLMLKDIFQNFKTIYTAEITYGDGYKPAPLAMLLRSQTLVDVRSDLSEFSGRQLKPKQLLDRLKEVQNV